MAIAVAFDDPSAESDLAVYRAQFHLPPCTTANGCFRKINQDGGTTPPPNADPGWALETALDTDAVSAACPDCHILLVEADNGMSVNLLTAVDQARLQGAKYISMSWGAPEFPAETIFDQLYFNHPGIAYVAGTGDTGYPNLIWPGASRFVTAVGGTVLNRERPEEEPHSDPSRRRRGWTETGVGRRHCRPCVALRPCPPPLQRPGPREGCSWRRPPGSVSAVLRN
ncbi:hypothetical protein [Kitasatospora sp. NPDC050543]|uniref:hypothetical protein n=1 Tax=Kitasatospora sp. NPDC050543 TaxID=3364054 RepID=UPI00379C6FD2